MPGSTEKSGHCSCRLNGQSEKPVHLWTRWDYTGCRHGCERRDDQIVPFIENAAGGDGKTLPANKIKGQTGSHSECLGLLALSRISRHPHFNDRGAGARHYRQTTEFLGFWQWPLDYPHLADFADCVDRGTRYLWKYRLETWLLAIAIGMFTHLIFDRMWSTPRTLFWPLYGWAFTSAVQRIGLGHLRCWHELFSNSYVYISETVGFLIFACFVLILLREKKLQSFLLKRENLKAKSYFARFSIILYKDDLGRIEKSIAMRL